MVKPVVLGSEVIDVAREDERRRVVIAKRGQVIGKTTLEYVATLREYHLDMVIDDDHCPSLSAASRTIAEPRNGVD